MTTGAVYPMGYIHKCYFTPGGISRQMFRIVADE
jgi:hypothetical protein